MQNEAKKQSESARKAAEPVLTEEQAKTVTGGATPRVAVTGKPWYTATVGEQDATFQGNTARQGGAICDCWDDCVDPKDEK